MEQKRKLGRRLLSFLFSLAMVLSFMPAMSIRAWEDDPLSYTLDGETAGGTNGYATESDINQNSVNWKVVGNTVTGETPSGNILYCPIRGKNLNEENRHVYSVDNLKANISKVELAVFTISDTGIIVNSIKMIVASNACFPLSLKKK